MRTCFSILLLCTSVVFAQTWLSLPMANAGVPIGDRDVPGTQMTVECLYTITNPAAIDLVSKHCSLADVNYLLRPT